MGSWWLDTKHSELLKRAELVRAQLVTYMQKSSTSYRDIGGGIGYSYAYLSWFKNAEHARFRSADSFKKLVCAIEQFLERAAFIESRQKDEGALVKTRVAKDILAALQLTHAHRDICCITAPSGYGKSKVLGAYCAANQSAILISSNASYSAKGLFEKIAYATRQPTGCLERMVEQSIRHFANKRGMLLIVDDAHYLKPKAFDCIRAVHDQSSVGVVIAGQPWLKTKVLGSGREEYAQIFSRVGIWRDEEKIGFSKQEVSEVIKAVVKCSFDEPIAELLWLQSQMPGALRRAIKLAERAVDIANEKIVTAEHIKTAQKLLGFYDVATKAA